MATIGDSIEPRSATSPSTSTSKSITVSCPSGTKVVGASGAVSGDNTAITRIRPLDDLSGVEVAAAEFGSGTQWYWTVTARANCAPGTFTLAKKSGITTTEASCPAGTKALGVGGEVTGGVSLTRIAPRTDLAGAVVEAAGQPTVTAYAICGSGQPGLVLRTTGTQVVTTMNGSKSVSCQGAEKVISAGGYVTGKAVLGELESLENATISGQSKDAETQAIRWSITPYAVCSP